MAVLKLFYVQIRQFFISALEKRRSRKFSMEIITTLNFKYLPDKDSRGVIMDWNTFWSTFIGGLAGGAIALLGSHMANKNQRGLHKKQLDEQRALFERQLSYNENNEKENLLRKKKEVATIFYYLIPEIAWEGLQLEKNAISHPTTIFCNYDFINALNILGDELDKAEMLYMVKLVTSIEAIKNTTLNSSEFRDSYRQFLEGFCNGCVNCGEYYNTNFSNSKRNIQTPFDKIREHKAEQITKDYILHTSYSDFVNISGNSIYSKLDKIKDLGSIK